MAALANERSVVCCGPESTGVPKRTPLLVKTGQTIYKGSLVATDATGYAIAGAGLAATGLKIWGIAMKTVVSGAAASGTFSVDVEQGDYIFANLGGDPVAQADIGAGVFADDDQTIRKTSNTSTRSACGQFRGFDAVTGLPIVRVGNFSQTGV
jgi:hypothetical protein